MRVRSTLKWMVAFGVLALGAGPAGAQQPTSPPAPADGQVSFSTNTKLSGQEMLAEADKSLAKMEGTARNIRQQLAKAREQRDVVKTLCLNDKLSQADVALKSAVERKKDLQAAVQQNGTELAGHQFSLITILRQRSEQLTAEANQCIGEEAAMIGQTSVKTEVEEWVPPNPDGYPPTDAPAVIGPPQCTSCTL
jgi:hypothetical protein